MNIILVFYTRTESDEELFLSAHVDEQGARLAAEADANEQGYPVKVSRPRRPSLGARGVMRWGIDDGRRNPNISGGKENPHILTDWTDPEDSASYSLSSVPLHGAEGISAEMFDAVLRLAAAR